VTGAVAGRGGSLMTDRNPPGARLRHYLASLPDPYATDAELVARFAATRDEAAFAELVRRHGPLVLAVCRRVTGNRDDADDAFQASFLVLARKADRVRPDLPLAGWLYGVAVRAARKAVIRTARRRSHETTGGELPDIPDCTPASDPDTVRAVLEEVARLSDVYRTVVVLCELEGRTRAAAARELGIAEGTLSSRLAAARGILARRFRDRGLAPAVLAAVAGSAACPVLAADAVRLFGASASPGPHVERLSEAVMKSALPVRWAVASALVVVSLGFAFGDGHDPERRPAARVAATAPRAAPAPVAKGPNKLLFYRTGHLTLIDPDGKNDKKVSENVSQFHPGEAKLSPDGAAIAFLISERVNGTPQDPRSKPSDYRHRLFVRKLDEPEPGTDTGVTCEAFAWSPDGAEIASSDYVHADGTPTDVTSCVFNLKTKKRTPLKFPSDHVVTDWTPDGKALLTMSNRLFADKRGSIYRMPLDGSEGTRLTDAAVAAEGGRLSPDGKRMLFNRIVFGDPRGRELTVLDLATGKTAKVDGIPANGGLYLSGTNVACCWSPDGKRIAYVWQERDGDEPGNDPKKMYEARLIVCDPDGKNAKADPGPAPAPDVRRPGRSRQSDRSRCPGRRRGPAHPDGPVPRQSRVRLPDPLRHHADPRGQRPDRPAGRGPPGAGLPTHPRRGAVVPADRGGRDGVADRRAPRLAPRMGR